MKVIFFIISLFFINSLFAQDSTKTQEKEKNQTGKQVHKKIEFVDEKNSTLEARSRYWQMYPATGLNKLIPEGLRLPPRPVDDIVAILLIERYYATQNPSPL